MEKVSFFWFRRDLRIEDNAGLYYALKSGLPIIPIFIFDTDILDKLEDKNDRRVCFIFDAIQFLRKELERFGSSILIKVGSPPDVWNKLVEEYPIHEVFANNDYEPYAVQRDSKIKAILQEKSVVFKSFKDQVIFEKEEILKDDKTPYTVFTPYSKKWKASLNDFYLKPYPTEKFYQNFYLTAPFPPVTLTEIGFENTGEAFKKISIEDDIIRNYEKTRNFPSIPGTTRISVHLRFGTISIRKLAIEANPLSETYLNELIWREFFMTILYHFPENVKHSFKSEYDKINWRNDEKEFDRWCSGTTGYPIVDAGMRELNRTGFMHNRVRLITASFLCKHLLIDWRWGEAYFGKKLFDYELSSNNGNWQWAAGCGVDAAPYFRIFNPYLQTEKFDKSLEYIKKWVPEFQELSYPKPIVDHELARKRALETYKEGLNRAL